VAAAASEWGGRDDGGVHAAPSPARRGDVWLVVGGAGAAAAPLWWGAAYRDRDTTGRIERVADPV